MVLIAEMTGYADGHHPLHIELDIPLPEGSSALVLVERLDDVDDEFRVDVIGLPERDLSNMPNRAKLYIGQVSQEADRIFAAIRPRIGGWFRARILWIKDRLPIGACGLCRRALAMLVSAAFALAGLPVPDLTVAEFLPALVEPLTEAIRSPPLVDVLNRIDERLADILSEAIGNFDLLRTGLDQLYRYCCKLLGIC